MKKHGQSLIEFIVVAPLLVLILFGITELILFWRTAQTVQEIALESAAGASQQYVALDSATNSAVDKAVLVVENRLKSLGLDGITLTEKDLGSTYGTKPFALYQYNSSQTRTTDNGVFPIITLTVDYRDPAKNGIVTQLIYQYRTLLLGAEFELPGGRKVVIIPKDIEISSTKIQQYNSY